jgi:hypothetical protein
MNVEMLCTVLVDCAQHLNVHGYSDWQQTTNTVHNISMFMPIQNGNKRQQTTNTVHNISTFMPIQNGNEPQA